MNMFIAYFIAFMLILQQIYGYGVSHCSPTVRGPTMSYCCLRTTLVPVETIAKVLKIRSDQIVVPRGHLEVTHCDGLCREADPNWNQLIGQAQTPFRHSLHEFFPGMQSKCVNVGKSVDRDIVYIDDNGGKLVVKTLHGLGATSCGCSA